MSKPRDGTLLLIGGNGYLGSLAAAGLLSQGNFRIIAPLRDTGSRDKLIEKIKSELSADVPADEIDFERLITMELPPPQEVHNLFTAAQKLDVKEIIHCAGSVDYFDSNRLKEVNIDLTSELISLGKKLQLERFVYLSTAFSSGYTAELIPETFHEEPDEDPTEYTKSKREAEALVHASGIPFLIVRPSVVIGDSKDGRYPGKAYGLYQLWSAFEKFLCDRYRPVLHFIAPEVKLQIVHQDAFQAGFVAAHRELPGNSIIHLTSKHETLPTVREVTELWYKAVTRFTTVHYYDRLSEVPVDELDRRMKMWLEFTGVNNDIAAYPWQFKTDALDKLRANGLEFNDATLDTVRICQNRFIAHSDRIQTFVEKCELELAESEQAHKPEIIPVIHTV